MEPYTLTNILRPFQQLTKEVALYLPRTSDLRQLAIVTGDNQETKVIHYCMEGASKVSLSLGSLDAPDLTSNRQFVHILELLM